MSFAGKVFLIIGIVLIVFAVVFFMGLFGLDPEESALVGMILLPIGGFFAATAPTCSKMETADRFQATALGLGRAVWR